MCEVENLRLISDADGTPLDAILCVPEGEVRALVQFAHGMCEHKERYLPFMRFLAERGFACFVNDHRGHGAAARERGELGYFGADGARALVEDMRQATQYLRERFAGKRVYLFGHSMGSLAARAYAARFDRGIDGLILCGSPAWNPGVHVGLLIARLGNPRKRSRLLKIMTFGPFYRAFKKENSKCAWICSDREVVRAYEQNPLCGFTFTNNGFLALFELMKAAYAVAPAQNPSLPVFFVSGEQDPCRGGEKGFEYAMSRMRKRGYAQVEGRVFAGMRHEICNEPRRREVYEEILQALERWEARP